MTTRRKASPNRSFITYTTAELKEVAEQFIDRPRLVEAVYVELQFRNRKAARELRDHLRGLLIRAEHTFRWPSTEAQPGTKALAEGVFDMETGLLRTLGYRVGIKGLGEVRRRDLLEDVYSQPLAILRGHPQEAQWGAPSTAGRLHKLANALATFTRNNKRQPRPSLISISEWEADLRYLKKRFYDGRYDFHWPRTDA